MKKMGMLLLCLTSQWAFAAIKWDEYELKLIQKAANAGQLQQTLAWLEGVKVVLKACEIEKTQKRIPYSCFVAYARLKAHGIVVAGVDSPVKLEKLCLRNTIYAQDIEVKSEHSLSPACRHAVRMRVLENQYKAGKDIE